MALDVVPSIHGLWQMQSNATSWLLLLQNIPFAVCDTKLDLSCLTKYGISLWSCITSYLFFDKSLMVLQHVSKRSPASSMSSLPSWNWTPIDLTLKLVKEICTVDNTPAWYIISLVSGSLYVDMIWENHNAHVTIMSAYYLYLNHYLCFLMLYTSQSSHLSWSDCLNNSNLSKV